MVPLNCSKLRNLGTPTEQANVPLSLFPCIQGPTYVKDKAEEYTYKGIRSGNRKPSYRHEKGVE